MISYIKKEKSDMKTTLKGLMQIGIIVQNVDEAVKNYEAMGVGPWDVSVMDTSQPPFDDLTFNGEKAGNGPIIKVAMFNGFGTEFELIEPIADSVYKTWLEEHGPGIHHLAFDMDGDYTNILAEHQLETGKAPWVRGQGIGGLMDYAYLDMRDETGLIVECYKSLQPDKPILTKEFKGEKRS